MKVISLVLVTGIAAISMQTQAADNAAGTTAAPQAAPATTTAPATPPVTTSKQDMAEQSGFSKGSVVRSVFTNEIKDREPTDKLESTDAERVYYFTELRDMNGQTATHRWEHDGKVMSEVKFNVNSNRWRVWSSKTFIPEIAGDWKVSVVNGAGEVIAEESIKINPADAASTPAAAPAADVQPAPAKATQ